MKPESLSYTHPTIVLSLVIVYSVSTHSKTYAGSQICSLDIVGVNMWALMPKIGDAFAGKTATYVSAVVVGSTI